jgi:Zn ribbon nucleic-acid-binding protein
MGSVIDYIECPNCSYEAFCDFYYKTGEEYVNCNNCGYHYSATIKNRDKKLTELSEGDWQIIRIEKPYGAYRYKIENELGSICGTLENKDDADKFRIEMDKNTHGVIEYAAISRLVEGNIEIETLIDKTNEPN